MAENYEASGFDQNLIRQGSSAGAFDNANIDQLLGETAIGDTKIKSVSASKITAGIIAAVANLGDESVVLDGENRRIVVYDEEPLDRVVIGKID